MNISNYKDGMEARIWSIIEEGGKTRSISRITSSEKEIIAMLYEEATGEHLNLYCGGCIVGACIYLYNQNIKDNGKDKKRNGKG